jgi:FAD:protein FMN transferase
MAICSHNVTNAASPVSLSGRAMGTTWSVKFMQPTGQLDAAMIERSVAERLEQLEQVFSTYRRQSEVSRFNAAHHTDWIPVSPEMVHVAKESRRISELTVGAFDVTVFPLLEAWGFGPERRSGSIPASAVIASARARVDWRRLELRAEPPALRKADPTVAVDFSSMAKGFAADEIGKLLAGIGAKNHLVQVGGDIKASGYGTDARTWRTAVEQPNEHFGLVDIVMLEDNALSTSGDYRNFFTANGRRYGHIIDPRTGEPVSGTLASVSVIHPSCATSSALATALFVLGADEGYRVAVREQLACLFQVREGTAIRMRATPQFQRWRQ